MKKFLLIAFFANASLVFAQTVNIQGNPYGGNPYPDIASAITASSSGDVILITGVHTEPVFIRKSISLLGVDPTTDIIQAAAAPANTGTGNSVINILRAADADVLTVTIENLGIRNGNADVNTNGGGINVDKATGLVTLKNLIIENNYTARNGGGVSFAGSNAEVIECTIRNNTSTLDGGGVIAATNNASGGNNTVNFRQSIINGNTGRNGGGLFLNGNTTFGNNYIIDVLIENTTVAFNNATSPSTGSGGGAIWSRASTWTGDGVTGNINLRFVHATTYSNTHAAPVRSGYQSSGTATNLRAYNSILVNADAVATRAVNFASTNTIDVVNCILGGVEGAPFSILDDTAKNNLRGRTATQAGLTSSLSSQGGQTQVVSTGAGSSAINYCSAAVTGVTLPTIDQRGATRVGVPDAGSFEFDGVLSIANAPQSLQVRIFPNPAREFVEVSGIDNVSNIKVYSLLGALEQEVKNTNTINVASLSSGIHLLVVEKDGQRVTEKLVIQ